MNKDMAWETGSEEGKVAAQTFAALSRKLRKQAKIGYIYDNSGGQQTVDSPLPSVRFATSVGRISNNFQQPKTRTQLMAKTSKTSKYVYLFGNKKADGDGSMKPLLGGKGANLAEMTRIGLPVPPGFTITTEVCTYYYAHKKTYPKELQAQMEAGIANMEKIMACKFGDSKGMP